MRLENGQIEDRLPNRSFLGSDFMIVGTLGQLGRILGSWEIFPENFAKFQSALTFFLEGVRQNP